MAQSGGTRTQIGRGSAIAAAVASAVALFTGQPVLAAFFVTFATSYTLGTVAARQAAKSAQQEVLERRDLVRSAVAPRRVLYGIVQTSGTLVYAQVTGASREYLHLVIALAGHEVTAIPEVWLDDTRLGALDGSGNVTTGAYAGLVRVKKYLGTAAQSADADLITESAGKWTSAHRGRGVAYLYIRVLWNQDIFTGVPNFRALVYGKPVFDPRTSTTGFSQNPALLLRDYFTSAFGLGCSAGEIDDAACNAAANVCDEWVALDAAVTVTPVPDHILDVWTTTEDEPRINTGDRIVLTGTPVPAGLSSGATYYVIRLDARTFRLASSLADALAGTFVTFTNNGSGAQTWGSIAQIRYAAGGSFTLDAQPAEVEENLRAAMAGACVFTEGKWRIFAGAYAAPTVSIGASDLRAALTVKPRRGRAQLVNQVRGTYTDPGRGWTVTDFPPVGSSTFTAQDGGEVIARSIDLSWVHSPYRAQRLAKILLNRNRGAQLVLPCKITVLAAATAETVSVTLAQLGYSSRTFRVVAWKLTGEDGGVGVDLTLEEDSAATYAWTASEALTPAQVPALVLPSSAIVAPPSNLSLSSGSAELIVGSDGTIVSRIRVTWTFAVEAAAASYEVQWKRSADADFASVVSVPAEQNYAYCAPVQDGAAYQVRVRTVRPSGQRSSWLNGSHTVVGKTAAPGAPTTLQVAAALNGFDIVWSASGEADYRHSLLYEAASNNFAAATVVATVAGNRAARGGLGAPVARWYWVRHVDTSGNQSAVFPAVNGITATTLAPSAGGVPTVANAAAITASPGSNPPGGDQYWAVYDNATGKIWRWSSASGAYSKAADGGDLAVGSVAADRIGVANLAAISANLGAITAGSLDIGSGKFQVGADGSAIIRSAATGARLEVTNNVIRVYDSAGVLRVKLGDLA